MRFETHEQNIIVEKNKSNWNKQKRERAKKAFVYKTYIRVFAIKVWLLYTITLHT